MLKGIKKFSFYLVIVSLLLYLSGLLTSIPKVAKAVNIPAAGFETVSVQTDTGPVTVTIPRVQYSFTAGQPSYSLTYNGDGTASVNNIGRALYAATNGADNNPGTVTQPWKTVQFAINQLNPGDLLYIRGGTYRERLLIDQKRGTVTSPIIIANYPAESVQIQNVPVSSDNPTGAGLKFLSTQNVWVYGLEIKGLRGMPEAAQDGQPGNGVEFSWDGQGSRLLNCTIHYSLKSGVASVGHQETNILTEGNLVYNNGVTQSQHHGIYWLGASSIIRGNAVFRNEAFGMEAVADYLHIYNNVSFENQYPGLGFFNEHNVAAHNVFTRGSNNLDGGAYPVGSNVSFWGHYIPPYGSGPDAAFNLLQNNIIFNSMGTSQVDMIYGIPNQSNTPHDNKIDYNVISPEISPTWWSNQATLAQTIIDHTVFKDPQVVNVDPANGIYDLRLQDASQVKGTAGVVALNGGPSNYPDPGIFPATYYTDPFWPFNPTPVPNVQLTKAADKADVVAGDTVTYTIAYQNKGTANASNVLISDVIPTGTTYVAGSATNSGTFANNTLSWAIGTVNSGASGSVSFKVTIN